MPLGIVMITMTAMIDMVARVEVLKKCLTRFTRLPMGHDNGQENGLARHFGELKASWGILRTFRTTPEY